MFISRNKYVAVFLQFLFALLAWLTSIFAGEYEYLVFVYFTY